MGPELSVRMGEWGRGGGAKCGDGGMGEGERGEMREKSDSFEGDRV